MHSLKLLPADSTCSAPGVEPKVCRHEYWEFTYSSFEFYVRTIWETKLCKEQNNALELGAMRQHALP